MLGQLTSAQELAGHKSRRWTSKLMPPRFAHKRHFSLTTCFVDQKAGPFSRSAAASTSTWQFCPSKCLMTGIFAFSASTGAESVLRPPRGMGQINNIIGRAESPKTWAETCRPSIGPFLKPHFCPLPSWATTLVGGFSAQQFNDGPGSSDRFASLPPAE